LALSGLALPDKLVYADWIDDRTTDASPRSVRSDPCDEPEDFDLADGDQTEPLARKLTWVEQADSDSEDEDETSSVDAEGGSVAGDPLPSVSSLAASFAPTAPGARWADILSDSETESPAVAEPVLEGNETASSAAAASSKRWADICESEEEFIGGPAELAVAEVEAPEAKPAPASRASRRARAKQAQAAAAAASAAAEEEASVASRKSENASLAGPGSHAIEKDCAKQHWENTSAKRNDKAAKGASKGFGKGADRMNGKGANHDIGKSAGKGSKKGGKGSKGGGKGQSEKYQCQIKVGIEEDNKFRVVRRLIGSGGENMKNINQQTGAKLRLRGRGSKFEEEQADGSVKESTDDLILCVSAQDKDGYDRAKSMASELIVGIHHSYRAYCHKTGKEGPELKLELHEGYRDGSW
jgi:hypothetical protein